MVTAGYRSEALSALAPTLTGAAQEQALTGALEIDNASSRAEALLAFIPELEGEAREQALAAALKASLSSSGGLRAETFAHLVPLLGEQMLDQALEDALALWTAWRRAEALAILAPALAGEARERALAAALEATLEIEDLASRVRVLEILAPQLAGPAQAQAVWAGLEAILTTEDERRWESALRWLLPLLSAHPDLRPGLQRTAARRLQDLRGQEREPLLVFLAVLGDLGPAALGVPEETFAEVAGHVIEICGEWRWV
jgi:hypothetical protein